VSVLQVGPLGRVIRPTFDPVARSFESLTDADWDMAWEQPMRTTITELQQAHHDGITRIVVVVPTTAMSGGSHYAHVAAPAEAIRVLVKSAARQWGADGITVNAVAVDPATVLDSPTAAGPVSIAAPALGVDADPAQVIAFLCSEAGGSVTGQTFVVDGGRWI
jgi:NAD(P)-dependent dehydrogenase (short-subunit alcohol dehydrogenase family)